MSVASILRHKGHAVTSVSPKSTVTEVAQTLATQRIGAVLVQDAAGQLLGIVSERDLVRAVAADGAGALEKTAAQLMTGVLFTVSPHTTVAQAMARMTECRVRHLPVLEDGELVGMISIGDVVKARIDQQASEVDSLTAYVAGSV
jgi:CBS domain-containing protein